MPLSHYSVYRKQLWTLTIACKEWNNCSNESHLRMVEFLSSRLIRFCSELQMCNFLQNRLIKIISPSTILPFIHWKCWSFSSVMSQLYFKNLLFVDNLVVKSFIVIKLVRKFKKCTVKLHMLIDSRNVKSPQFSIKYMPVGPVVDNFWIYWKV